MKHILVVDDSLVIRETLKKFFESNNYKVSTVEDGHTFYNFIESNIPDIIILDKMLPDDDGFNILYKMKLNAKYNSIPVIMFTTQDQYENEITGLKLGAECFLSKDIKLEELKLWVDRLIAKQEKIVSTKNNLKKLSLEIEKKESLLYEKAIELKKTNEKLIKLSYDLIMVLLKTIEVKDVYTKNHSENVSNLSLIIASYIGFTPKKLNDVKIAGYLHDIGKIGISETILNYPNKLDTQSRRIIENHPILGADIIKSVDSLSHLASFVRQHHENFDGSGYPDKLIGEEISIEGRILRIADFFDALSTDRVYRPAYSVEETLNMMKGKKGIYFDPEILETFFKIIKKGS